MTQWKTKREGVEVLEVEVEVLRRRGNTDIKVQVEVRVMRRRGIRTVWK